jgi:tetratricopeptide (TPR) repeat protein
MRSANVIAILTLAGVLTLFARLAGPAQSGRADASAPPEPGPASIQIDYPEDGSIFPPEITPPTFIWRETSPDARIWEIEIGFGDGGPGILARTRGERLRIGPIDPRAVSSTNRSPELTPQQAAARSWIPSASLWAEIKKRSTERPAKITIRGFPGAAGHGAVSQGSVVMQTSRDPVGAPIFYRDVPLMPSELEKGVIKPLAQAAVPLIAWRLRNIDEPRSNLLVEGLHSCANCHSFAMDGKTLGMDLDGPQNDKALYALTSLQPTTLIRNEDVISWRSFRDQPAPTRAAFMSQVSPAGQYVLTTVGTERDLSRNYYVANFKDYRFLQVFYPTRGILVWYDRANRQRQALHGADDPRYVQANGVWSPDGRYIVFARAEAQDPYPQGRKMAEYANDPNEPQIKYDLYRIPFNGGRGGTPEPIEGASRDGMSNSFPKVSPNGRWIVYVRARNGLLMRPDSQLYIVPAEGGVARRMRCNTSLMNSWHSFSPNGRWLVFSSKARSPYTQMYLTHIDEQGRDSPAILIDNATAANRAVNLPEFVNVRPDGLRKLEVPAAAFYAQFDRASELAQRGRYKEAVVEWRSAVVMNPGDAKARNNLGFALAREGRRDEAIAQWEKALAIDDEYPEVHRNLGRALLEKGMLAEAIVQWRKFVEAVPEDAPVRESLGVALLRSGDPAAALPHLQKALELSPGAEAEGNLGRALLQTGQTDEAVAQFESALRQDSKNARIHNDLGVALLRKREFELAIAHFRQATRIEPKFAQAYFNLGSGLYLRRNFPEALAQWRAGLQIEPGNVAVLKSVAWILAAGPVAGMWNGSEAVRFATRAMELSGGRDPAILDVLGAAYAQDGRFAEALETARRALALATEQGKTVLAEDLKKRAALYQKRQPFRTQE